MAILVHNIRLGVDEPASRVAEAAARKLGVPAGRILSLRIARKSFDARPRHRRWVYSVEVALAEDEDGVLRSARGRDVQPARPVEAPRIEPGRQRASVPPVVVGAGPAGMFAALLLACAGYRPILLDRGRDVDRRRRNIEEFIRHRRLDTRSNFLFGEGGAGTYSDGKLYTRTRGGLAPWVVRQFVRFGADEEIAVSARPHVGSDVLPEVCRRMRREIASHGGSVRFDACVDDVELAGGRAAGLRLAGGERLEVSCVLLGIGHSARDTYRMLAARGVRLSAKPFQMGLRIEHPQELIDRAQLGPYAGRAELTPVDYSLVARRAAAGRDVYTFCMCPGGRVLPANHQEGTVCTNGGSRRARDSGWANSALVSTVRPDDFGRDPLAGLALQEKIERAAFDAAGGDYSVPAQRAGDFLARRAGRGPIETSSLTGARACDLGSLLPAGLAKAIAAALETFDGRIPGFAGPAAVLMGPETRASGPVRIDRDRQTRASVSADNLYPIGEGAGYAGGIVSAAIDGLKSAQAVIAKYAPVE